MRPHARLVTQLASVGGYAVIRNSHRVCSEGDVAIAILRRQVHFRLTADARLFEFEDFHYRFLLRGRYFKPFGRAPLPCAETLKPFGLRFDVLVYERTETDFLRSAATFLA